MMKVSFFSGAGSLGLAVEGPSEAAMDCADNKDGTATVEYVPTEEGDYVISVKFADEDIPGSPFTVHKDCIYILVQLKNNNLL